MKPHNNTHTGLSSNKYYRNMFQRYMAKIEGYMYTIIYFTGKIRGYKIIYLTEKNRKFHTYNIATDLNSYKAKKKIEKQ